MSVTCSAPGCAKNVHTRGLCVNHYALLRRNGHVGFKVVACGTCGGPTPSHRHRFCSQACANGRDDCEACGREFTRSRQGKCRGQRFCSQECARAAMSYALDTTRPATDGYVEVKAGVGPGTDRHGWILEHRHVMQEALGRPLLPSETVHHVNGDKLDNALSNLELWSTSQPKGQRVVDKVLWAKEILALYGSALIAAD